MSSYGDGSLLVILVKNSLKGFSKHSGDFLVVSRFLKGFYSNFVLSLLIREFARSSSTH